MKPMSKELADLYDERVALGISIALLQEDGSDQAAIDKTRELLTTVNYRISRIERLRLEPGSAERAVRPRHSSRFVMG
jgi:hypothetical protein